MHSSEQCQHLEEYLHGEIGDADRALFESHLRDCTTCVKEVEAVDQVDALIRGAWADVVAPAELNKTVQKTSAENPDPRKIHWPTLAAVAAAIVLLGSLTFFATRLNTQPDLSKNTDRWKTGQTDPDTANVVATDMDSKEPVVNFHQTGSSGDAILVPTTNTNAKFTIVRAYRPISRPISISQNQTRDQIQN